jgi:hypothetical protein
MEPPRRVVGPTWPWYVVVLGVTWVVLLFLLAMLPALR